MIVEVRAVPKASQSRPTVPNGWAGILNSDPQDLDARVRIDAVFGEAPVQMEDASQIELALKSLNFSGAFGQNAQIAVLLAILGSKYAGKIGAEETKDRFFDQLLELTKKASAVSDATRSQASDEAVRRLAGALAIVVGNLCTNADPAKAAEALCARMERVLHVSPKMASFLSFQFDNVIRQLPIDCQSRYWPLALTSRAVW